jgi:hypothetical protein
MALVGLDRRPHGCSQSETFVEVCPDNFLKSADFFDDCSLFDAENISGDELVTDDNKCTSATLRR